MTDTWAEIVDGAESPLAVDGASTDPARQLLWSDDFTGPAGAAPDPTRWVHDVGGLGWGDGEQQAYTDSLSNAALDGQSNLAITARQEPGAGGAPYTSARLHTEGRFEFTYGYVEARVRLPQMTQGIWPAFWTLGPSAHPWPTRGEIDIFELVSTGAQAHFNLHQPTTATDPGGGNFTRWGPSVPSADAPGAGWDDGQFHRWGLLWTPSRIDWSVDGVVYGSAFRGERGGDQLWVFDTRPQHLLLNIAVGGAYPGPPDGTTVLPVTMLVDWVRVYATADTLVPG